MGEVLGLGVTHGPYVLYPEAGMAGILRRILMSPKTPAHLKEPSAWPEPMRREWGEDQGLSAAHEHRMRLVEGFRRARKALDDFKPDVVIIFGDDQYENFKEDVVPAFCVFAHDEYRCQPFKSPSGLGGGTENVWNESGDFELVMRGAKAIGKDLATALLHHRIDIAYSYKPLHHPMAHAFWRTVAHLDYDRRGFDYPIIPFHVNCYGSGFTARMGEDGEDPPGPTPARCMEVGAAVARWARRGGHRVAIVGSSSWSHAFLTKKHHYLWPDVESDRRRFAELRAGDYEAWRNIPIEEIEENGQHEMLNWMCLAGAMSELGQTPRQLDFVETWIFNSCKTMAVFG
ncbi:MAG: extradiol ring-cleavage dioxygenase [SAR202 cluster bacterium]|nr:extradiol ring-cleavage dioxygenase [SAR202 cluster bacterium]